MKKLLFIFLIISLNLSATNYYVSNTGGGDTLTISELNVAMQSMNDGDYLYFQSGKSFYTSETITIPKALNCGIYGGSENATITALQEVTGWTQLNDSTYSKVLTSVEPTLLIYDNNIQQKGNWSIGDSVVRFSYVNSSDLNNVKLVSYTFNKNIVGREIKAFLRHSARAVYDVFAQSGDTAFVKASIWGYWPQDTTGGYGTYFALQDNPEYFRYNGNWSWNNDSLYISCRDGIVNHKVYIPTVDTIFNLAHTGDLKFNNINFTGASYKTMVTTTDYADVYFTDCAFKYSERGLSDNIGANSSIYMERCSITQVTDYGLYVGLNQTGNGDTVIVQNCFIDSIGIWDELGKYNVGRSNGVALRGSPENYSEVSMCTGSNIGYNFWALASNRGNSEFFYNYLKDADLLLPDGGLHTGASPTLGRVHVHHNIIDNVGYGLYQDFSAANQDWDNNLVLNCKQGYFGNNPSNSTVLENIFWKTYAGIAISNFDNSTAYLDTATNFIASRNITVSAGSYDGASDYHFTFSVGTTAKTSGVWDSVKIGIIDTNYIFTDGYDSRIGNIYGGSITQILGDWDLYQSSGYEPNSVLTEILPSLRINYSKDTVQLSNDSIYTLADGTSQRGGEILPRGGLVTTSIVYSEYTPPTPYVGFKIYKGNKVEYLFIK